MTRTKRPQKNSSLKKDFGQSILTHRPTPVSRELSSSGQRSDDLNNLLMRKYESPLHFQEEFVKFHENKLKACQKHYESACQHVKKVFKDMIGNLPDDYLNSIINSNFNESLLTAEGENLRFAVPKARSSRARKVEPATCEFKRPKTPRVNRSSSRKRSVSAPPPMAPPSADRFKTPTNSLLKLGPMSVITPKVSATPMCILRRPDRGEVAFAATGSPLLVGRVSLEDVPTVTVPLQDGRIFSILPDPGAAPSNLPEFDEETKRYLKTLQKHLEYLAPSP